MLTSFLRLPDSKHIHVRQLEILVYCGKSDFVGPLNGGQMLLAHTPQPRACSSLSKFAIAASCEARTGSGSAASTTYINY